MKSKGFASICQSLKPLSTKCEYRFIGRSSGQTFMPDYLASLLIFGILAAIFLNSWNSVLENQTRFEREDRMKLTASYTTDFLVSTPGYPNDWNSSNVLIPGFTDQENIVEQRKLEEFGELDYSRQKKLLKAQEFYLDFRENGSSLGSGDRSIGSGPVAYIVESSDDFTDVKLLHELNSSSVTWDLYWPSDSNQGDLRHLNSRNVYNYTDQADVMFDDIISNATKGRYSTVIAEDINVGQSEIENGGSLRKFIEEGGTYLHTESKVNVINSIFDLETSGSSSEPALIEKVSPLLNSTLSKGETVEFDDSPASYPNPDQIFANSTEPGSWCLACRWDIGAGELYFLSDTASADDSILAFDDADSAVGMEFSFGRKPVNASTVIPLERSVVVKISNRTVEADMRYLVWR